MSYWNPSPDEAYDEFYNNKRKYSEAYNKQRVYEKQRSNFEDQQIAYKRQADNLKSEKLNFNKRLEGIRTIIRKLESLDVNTVSDKILQMDEAYGKSIAITGDISYNISEPFKVKTVTAQTDSNSALEEYRKRYGELEDALTNINSEIQKANNSIEQLNKQVNEMNGLISQMERNKRNAATAMDHYKKYI